MHPNSTRRYLTVKSAFTLIELLVAMTVLTLLTLCVAQLVASATSVTTGGRKRLDADSQARVVFDRLSLDFSKMLKRTDVHYLFVKVNQGSDKMFFYSEAPSFYDTGTTPTAQTSSVALLGYRINAAYQCERLGKRLSWDGNPTDPAPGSMVFLSPPQGGGSSFAPDNASTLAGNWPAVLGSGPTYDDGSDADYHALAEQAFRLEFCYQLQDGTYGTVPVLNPANTTNNLIATVAPTTKDDYESGKYSVGSRWYDQTGNCAYVCTNSIKGTPGTGVWKTIGMQDVRAVVVAVAILDAATSKTLPLGPAVNIGTTKAPYMVQPPKLDLLVQAFADAPLPQGNTGEIGSAGTPTALYFPPTNVPSSPTSQPARLMAEVWNNQLKALFNNGTPPINRTALSQVHIYQRYFALNNTPASQ